MKTLASVSYNIAWFKLADFVTRGEKERALSILRLLMHSINDPALTLQLEGDILLAFDDQAAFHRYQNAALLFQKLHKFQQAIGICQHALLFKHDEKILEIMLETYILMQHPTGILLTFEKLAKIYITKDQTEALYTLTDTMSKTVSIALQALLHGRLLIAILLHDSKYAKLDELITKIINLYQHTLQTKTSSTDLTKFLSEVKAVDIKIYQQIEGSMYEQDRSKNKPKITE